MLIEDALNTIDEMLDASLGLPFSGGKCLVDVDKMRDIIDDIRMNMPKEIQQAEDLLVQRGDLIRKAGEQSENIIKKAEERARILLAQDEAVKSAQKKANEIVTQAQAQSRELKMATQKFADNIMRESEASLDKSLKEIQKTRTALRGGLK